MMARISSPPRGGLGEVRQFLRFRPGEEERLVRLEDIVECIPMVALEQARREESLHYRGLLHFRGRVVPVFDVSQGQSERLDPDWFLLVLQASEQEVAVVARDVFEILSRPAGDYREVSIGEGSRMAVVSAERRLFQVLEPDELIL